MTSNNVRTILTTIWFSGTAALFSAPLQAQDAQNNQQTETVPPVEVIQETPKPKKKKKIVKKKAPASTPTPVVDVVEEPQIIEPGSMILMSPIGGSEIPIQKVPSAVSTTSGEDFDGVPTSTLQNLLQSRVPGVIITDLQGNDFQTEVQYRGFSSSPVNGVAQGLAIYQNGVRINESFGDTVNWDFLPSNAIDSITVVPGNPVFGLNAIGGAISLNMRNGFNFQGTELDVLFGSYGRKWGSMATGMQSDSGVFSAFLAIEGVEDDGWRDFSPSEVKRIYADIGMKTETGEFHLNFTGADNYVGVVAASPVPLLDVDWNRTFTSPQATENELAMISLNGKVKATETLTLSGVGYFRKFKQKHDDGNLAEFEACVAPENPLELCDEENEPLEGPGGNPVLVTDVTTDPEALGSIDRTSQDAESWGGTLQAVSKANIFGFNNQFLIGASADHGEVDYTANSEPGEIIDRFVVAGSGIILEGGDDFTPRDISTENNYYGVYFSNTLDLTNKLALTVGGRYNYAEITIQDNTGEAPELNGTNTYERFNPMAGATYQLFPGLTLYGSYAEANRAPTAAELACSNPENPCLIESFLTDDPPLEQVVSHTWEAGLRGQMRNLGGSKNKVKWSIGYFNALNENDIISIASPEAGRGFFQNVGDTRREGIEASITYQTPKMALYANYNYTLATYEDSFVAVSAGNPNAVANSCPAVINGYANIDADDCLFVSPGDRLPGIPEHKFKAGIDYWLTQKWMVGADVVVTSDQVFFGDESNVAPKLSGYEKVDVRTAYNITDKVQIYGYVENIFDKQYGLFGTFFDQEEAGEVAEAAGYADNIFDNDSRTIMPSKPVAAYVGIKIKLD